MTPQEQQLLQGLTDRVNQTQLTDKDPEAEQFIFQALGRNTDSLYILAQTVLVQQYALDQAKKQLDQANLDLDHARQLAQQPVKHTSFLGSLLGTDEPAHPAPPPPPPAYQPVQTYAPPVAYGQPVAYAQPVAYGAPQYGGGYGAPPGGGQSGGFLRSAMTTATGVAAGALAFEGIESLMHGFDQHAGYGAGSFGGMGGGPREEVVNNYYGDASPEHHSGDLSDRFAAAGDSPSSDIEDRRGFSNDTQPDVVGAADTDNFADDNSDSSDDSGSYDDGGSDDSGSSDDSSF
jgi:uncharacterized protein